MKRRPLAIDLYCGLGGWTDGLLDVGYGTTIGAIVKATKMPFSTVSRVAFSLERRGMLTYGPHPTDRRKKVVRANLAALG